MNHEQKLREALKRLIEGKPTYVSIDRKVSFSAVEDEAKVSRGLLRNYPYLYEEVKNLKNTYYNRNSW